MADQTQQSPESRLLAAGFIQSMGLWRVPDGERLLSLDDALARLDSGEIQPIPTTASFPDTGVRALSEDLVERMFRPPPPPPPEWLGLLAELVADKVADRLSGRSQAA